MKILKLFEIFLLIYKVLNLPLHSSILRAPKLILRKILNNLTKLKFLDGVVEMVKCPRCGQELPEGAKFCFNCGKALVSEAVPPPKITGSPPPKIAGPGVTKPVPRPSSFASTAATRPGSCFYHELQPAEAICSRCGRSICGYCMIPYGDGYVCPNCITRLPPPPPKGPKIALIIGVAATAAIIIITVLLYLGYITF